MLCITPSTNRSCVDVDGAAWIDERQRAQIHSRVTMPTAAISSAEYLERNNESNNGLPLGGCTSTAVRRIGIVMVSPAAPIAGRPHDSYVLPFSKTIGKSTRRPVTQRTSRVSVAVPGMCSVFSTYLYSVLTCIQYLYSVLVFSTRLQYSSSPLDIIVIFALRPLPEPSPFEPPRRELPELPPPPKPPLLKRPLHKPSKPTPPK